MARFCEGRCCLRDAWPLRGAEGGLDGLWVWRRAESKGVEVEGAVEGGAGAGAEEDLMGMEGVKLMVGRTGERVPSPLVEGGGWVGFCKLAILLHFGDRRDALQSAESSRIGMATLRSTVECEFRKRGTPHG